MLMVAKQPEDLVEQKLMVKEGRKAQNPRLCGSGVLQ